MPQDPELIAGRFQIESLIAQGGMARVYKGKDLSLGRTVAVKVLSADLAADPKFVTRFRMEARSAASLSHPNIVATYDTGSDEDLHYIVMEYLTGRTVQHMLADDGPVEPRKAAAIAAQVAWALDEAHRKGLTHRDIKPANIMVTQKGQAKVMDFGIAKAATATNLTQVGSVLGTVAYISPEQARGEDLDGRSDIYSLGATLYQMLTGIPPLSGETILDTMNKLQSEIPDRPSLFDDRVPSDLDAVVMKALSKDRVDRYQTAGEMAQALRSVSKGDVLAAGAATPVAAAAALGDPGGAPTAHSQPTRVIDHGARPPAPALKDYKFIIAVAAAVALVAIAYVLATDQRNIQQVSPTPSVGDSPLPQGGNIQIEPAAPQPSPSPAESPSPSPSPSPPPPPGPSPEPSGDPSPQTSPTGADEPSPPAESPPGLLDLDILNPG